MKRVVSSVLLIISGILIGTLIYLSEKPDIREFIVKETKFLFYSDFSKIEDIEEFEVLIEEFGYDYEELGELKKYKKYLKQLMVLDFGEDEPQVLFLDFDNYYIGLRFRIGKYFEKQGELYKLKPKYSDGMELYVLPLKGYFVASRTADALKGYLGHYGGENEEFLKAYEESKADYPFFSLVGLEKNLEESKFNPGVKLLRFTLSSYDGLIRIDVDHFEDLQIAEMFETSALKSRKLVPYIGRNRMYFSNNDIKNLGISFKSGLSLPMQRLIESIKFFTGLGFEEILENIDNELCIDLDKKAMVASIKNPDGYSGLFKFFNSKKGEFFEISDNLKVLVEDDRVYFNSKLEIAQGEQLGENEFLCINVDMNKLDRKFDPSTDVQVRMASDNSRFRLSFVLSLENLRKMYEVLKIDGTRGIESDKVI